MSGVGELKPRLRGLSHAAAFLAAVPLALGWGRGERLLALHQEVELARAKLESVSQTDRETVVSYAFQGLPDNALADFHAELNAAAGPSSYNVFFNRPGAP